MATLLIHTYRIVVRNVKRKKIYQFSDTHLTEWDAWSSEEEKQKALTRSCDWMRGRFAFARAYNEPCGEAQALPAKCFFEMLLEESKKADVLIMAGDIIDFHTEGNARLLENALKNHPVPYLLLRGNHEELDYLPMGHPMKSAGEPVQKLNLGDMIILGFDDADRVITNKQIDVLKETLQQEKPVLISMHIPILTEGNAPKDNYFYLNYEGCPKENLIFIRLIRENADKIIAVTCGHLHGIGVSEICPSVTQYVSSQGLIGSLSIFDIGE